MTKPINVIVIDDEPDAIDFLIDILSQFDYIQVVGTAGEVDSGVETIIEHNPDIVFLDINMPGKNGFELITKVNELKMNTTVIFTTAYYEYAVDAFEKDVFGYLMKPIQIEKLRLLINRYMAKSNLAAENPIMHKLNTFIGFIWIAENEILGCKADGNYTDITLTSGQTETVLAQLGKIQDTLQGNRFIRIHRSSLINLNYFHRFNRKTQTVDLHSNGISQTYRISLKNIPLLESLLDVK